MNDPKMWSAVSFAVQQFIDFTFASILFSCVASFVQMAVPIKVQTDGNAPPGPDPSPRPTASSDWPPFRLTIEDLLDRISRVLVALLASLYFYLIYKIKIGPLFESSGMVQTWTLIFSIAAAMSGGAYLFARIEYYAMGGMLLVSAVCCAGIHSCATTQDSFFLMRFISHAICGSIIIALGVFRSVKPLEFKKVLRFYDAPILHPVLRIGMGGLIVFMIWWSFYK